MPLLRRRDVIMLLRCRYVATRTAILLFTFTTLDMLMPCRFHVAATYFFSLCRRYYAFARWLRESAVEVLLIC